MSFKANPVRASSKLPLDLEFVLEFAEVAVDVFRVLLLVFFGL